MILTGYPPISLSFSVSMYRAGASRLALSILGNDVRSFRRP